MTFSSYDLCGPDPNPMTREEVDALKELTLSLPEEPIIVNIGAERGTSTIAMLEERPLAYIYSVDIGTCPQEYANIQRAGLDCGRVVRIQGRSQEVGIKFYGGPVDLLFVDGDHSKAGVAGDIKAWYPHVKEGGIIAFHDYIPEPIPEHIKGRAVYAIDEWTKNNYEELEELTWVHRLIAFKRLCLD